MYDRHYPLVTLKDVLARDATARTAGRAIRALQGLRGDNLQSGEDSGLRDVWDEICVQIQVDLSVMWDAYVDTIERTIEILLESTPRTQLHAMWLKTDQGEEWLEEAEAAGGGETDLMYGIEDVVEYVREEVLCIAADWSNRRIRRYEERH